MSERIGFVGLGTMGRPMAGNLVEAGYEVRALCRHERHREAAEAIGIEVADLRAALEDGQTPAEVAEANDVSRADLVDAIVADITDHIEQGVEDGDLTQAEADERLAAECPIVRLTPTRQAPPRPDDEDDLGAPPYLTAERTASASSASLRGRTIAEGCAVTLPDQLLQV